MLQQANALVGVMQRFIQQRMATRCHLEVQIFFSRLHTMALEGAAVLAVRTRPDSTAAARPSVMRAEVQDIIADPMQEYAVMNTLF
jgi:hypothetical protein